ncbi:MAG: glycosyltransferase [Oscillospiraceae bacterium]|jgi:glycosyltransferase involved in cell wall biosynthesis|nr:glycosyltransferase [Oscillospiraceae bacterium]
MNIAQFTNSFLPVVDGVGRVVVASADHLGRRGHRVHVYAPETDMGALDAYHFEVTASRSFPMPGKLPYRICLPDADERFRRALQSTPLDLVHVHDPFPFGLAGRKAARKRSLPLVGTFHSKYYDDFRAVFHSEAVARYGAAKVADFYASCDEVWVVGAGSIETLREYGYRGDCVVMGNGVELRTLDSAVLPELRARYALPEGEPVLLFVGQLNWKKNLLRLLEASALLAREGLAFRLLLAGQGPHREEMADKARDLGIENRLTFTGHLRETRELDGLYALARLFVFPSLYDTSSMVLREAAAMGTPSVVVAGSQPAECIKDGENGLTCGDDAASLADAMRRALVDQDFAARLGQAAKATIPVPWAVLAEKMEARYVALLGRKG